MTNTPLTDESRRPFKSFWWPWNVRKLTEEHRNQLLAVVAEFHEENRAAEEKGKPLLVVPWLEVVSEDANFLYMRGPGGMVGTRPKGEKIDPSWDCPRCGYTAWNGTRCVICGIMDDGD